MTLRFPRPDGRSCLARFARDRGGAVAVLLGVSLLVIAGVVGSAVDYSRAARTRTQAQAAVDAAALAGVQKLARQSEAEATAVAVFTQNAPEPLRGVRPAVTVTNGGDGLNVCASGTIETTIARVLGILSLPLSACAAAMRPVKQYTDIYLALDVSASMGLAADEAGRDRLRALTGCAFACHEVEGGQTQSNYEVARQNGIQTRVDVLREATRTFARDLLDPRDSSNGAHRNEVRFAMFSVADDAGKLLAPPTPSQSRVENEVDRIRLAFNTQFDLALPAIDREMGTQMDGSDRQRPRKLVFLVTDGVQSKRGQPWESNAFRPIDVPLCDAIKRRGIPVAVLNIRYVPMPSEAAYNGTVGRFQNQLTPNLKACASDGLYFEAEKPDEIMKAFARFSAALASYRIAR